MTRLGFKNLEKLKKLRGLFYRKVVEEAERRRVTKEKMKKMEEAVPGFAIKSSPRMAEFPSFKNIKEVDITYPLLEPFAYVNIKWDDEKKEVFYNLMEPKITKEDKEMVIKVSDALIELVEVEMTTLKDPLKAIKYLEKHIRKIVKEFGLKLTPDNYIKLMYYIYRNFIGYNEIEPLLRDPNIEDISCDGTGVPLYVVHRRFGSLKTNVVFDTLEYLRDFVVKLAERAGRYVSYAEPILDGTLPDGSRVAATLAGDVATRGPSFTIRKFGEKPLSPVEQIGLGTASPDILAYLWYMIEHRASMLIVGGTATGKTSFLNALCMFIPFESKIISIEDTREIKIPHEHWVPGLTRVGFGIPMPTGEKYGGVTLFDLLKESFRQNPDYVIVGETRGNEAYVMFQGMASGHSSFSTFHAGSVDTVIKRLTSPPIDLSPMLLESLDVIIIMVFAKEKGKSARRIKEIVEIESVDAKTNEVKTKVIFRWDPVKDVYEKGEDSIKLRSAIASRGGTLEDAMEEVKKRSEVLRWMKKTEVKDFMEFTKMINLYYKDPKKIVEMMGKPIGEIQKKVEEKEPKKVMAKEAVTVEKEPKKRVSLLELLGYKVIEEK